VPDINNHRNQKWKDIRDSEHLSQIQMWYSCDTFTRREMALLRFFESGELQEYGPREQVQGRTYLVSYNPGVAEQCVNICIDVAQHLGVESLKMLLPVGLHHGRARLEEIKERVSAIPHADMARSRDEDAPWMGIHLSSDCHEGISMNVTSEEELAEELAEAEAKGVEE
jgi:hypothetical protein